MVAMLLAAPAVARAQGAQVAGGYAHLTELDSERPPLTADTRRYNGWYLNGTARLWRRVGVVGQASGHVAAESTGRDEVDLRVFGGFAGVRFDVATTERLTWFLHATGGVVRLSARLDADSEARTHGAFALGGGAEVRVTRRIGAQFLAEYRRVPALSADHIVLGIGLFVRF